MNEEKRFGGAGQGFGGAAKESADQKEKTSAASRARNRTVMLTPEMTGQVRALLYQEPEEEPRRDPLTELLPPMDWTRPDRSQQNAPAAEPAREAAQPANHDYNRDISTSHEEARGDRTSSTGKIDLEPVHEALAMSAQQPEAPRRPSPPANPVFSVNPHSSGRHSVSQPVAPTRRPAADPRQKAAPSTRVIGFLVSFDKDKNGEVHEVRAGRWLITSRPTDQGDYILLDDPSVSPLHAIVRATKDGKVEVLDQLSENGTSVRKVGEDDEIDAAGVRVSVEHGDVIRFGERAFVLCMIPEMPVIKRTEEEE